MQYRKTFLARDEAFSHPFRVIGILLELTLEQCKQFVIGADKFFSIFLCHARKVTDDPALRFKLPFIRQPDKTILRSHIREERELPATQGPKVPLALSRPKTGKQDHILWCAGFEASDLFGIHSAGSVLAFIPAPLVPEIRMSFQVIPFALIGGRDGMTDVAAKWLATGVMRRTLLATIKLGN